jgi:hypothetical protein
MKLAKSQLKQLIKEELQRVLNEADVIQGPWEGKPSSLDLRPDEDNPRGYEYEAIQEELTTAASNAVLRKVLEIAHPYHRENEVQKIIQEVKADIEFDMLDAMREVAKSLYFAIEPFKAQEREEEEERQYLERDPTPDDWPEF